VPDSLPGYGTTVSHDPAEPQETERLREGLKRIAVILKEADVPFALAGGYAAWSHGSPEPLHDVDFLVRAEDAAQVEEELRRRELEVLEPPEDWLFKVRVEGAAVDIIHRGQGSSIDSMLAAAEEAPVLSVVMPVITATDVTTEKLLALDEHYCDLAEILPTLRALREQVDWPEVRRRVAGAPFAEAVLYLLERLDVLAPARP
jgi:predicted nucleotidyltransferase